MVIFIDLDGTLLYDGNVSQRNRKAIKKTQEQGNIVVLCTARPLSRFVGLMDEMGIRYAIAGSGAVIYDRLEDKLLFKKTIDADEVDKILKLMKKNDFISLFCTGQQAYSNSSFLRDYDKISQRVKVLGNIEDLILKNRENIVSFIPHSFDFDSLHELYKQAIKDGLNVTGASKAIVEGGGRPRSSYYVEIAPRGLSKGTGVDFILDHLGADSNNAIAIGDGYNDIEMFKRVKTSVAMGNCVPGLLGFAMHRTLSNQDDGVAVFLESLG